MSVGRSNPARRAVIRWAWRLFRREWRQQLTVLTLITVAVAGSVTAAAMTVNGVSRANGELGDATALIHVDANDPDGGASVIAAATQRFGEVEAISHHHVSVPGLSRSLDVRDQDPQGRFGHSTLRLRDGRYPTAAGEVALTRDAAAVLGAGIGERVQLGRLEATVVGLVENPRDLRDEFALLAPGTDSSAESVTLLVDTNRSAEHTSVDLASGQAHLQVETFSTDAAAVAAVLLVAITLAMALVGLIATAGFVVVAQRRQRQLGLLAAIGATTRHLRLVMLANGAIVGLTAAVVGAVVGIVGWVLAAPAIETAAAHRIDRFDLPWGLIAACMGIAVVMSSAAAWWPARTMARLPVISALSGRPTRPAAVHRSLAVAAGLLALGVAGIVVAHPTSDHVRPLVLIAGVVAVVLGIVVAAPAAIRALAVPARHAPFAARLALRDLVRYQARAAAALAAVTLGVGIAVTVVVLAQANVAPSDHGNLSDRQLVISVGDTRTSQVAKLTADAREALDARAAEVTATLGAAAAVFPLDVAMNPEPKPGTTREASAVGPSGHEPVSVVRPIGNGFRGLGYAYVATAELLAHYGIELPATDDTTELLTSLPGDVLLLDTAAPPERGSAATPDAVQRADLPRYSSAPTSLITPGAMDRHGWVAARVGWFVETSEPLTSSQIAAARQAAAAVGLTIEVRDAQDGLARLRTIATTIGALLALAIVAMTIGLIRSESARDLRTLTATGASGRTRRALTATTAGALALLGALLGTVGAYVALVAAYHADLARLVPIPVVNLVALVVGLPVVAAGAGWLLAGREPKRFARQALD